MIIPIKVVKFRVEFIDFIMNPIILIFTIKKLFRKR